MEVLSEFQNRGYILIIVSNQSGVAKELYAQKDVEVLHKYLLGEFQKEKIKITEIYYCIHHPDTTKCICRKPDPLFIEKSLARFNINPAKSFFIGDKDRDIQAGEKAGVKSIFVEANSPLKPLLNVIQ